MKSGGMGVEEISWSCRRTSCGSLRDHFAAAGNRLGELAGEEVSGKGRLCLDREDKPLG